MKAHLLVISLAVVMFGFSCKKSEVTTNDFACDKTAKIARQSFGDLAMVVEYNSGKISKVYRADGKGLTENYTYKSPTEVTITRNFSDGSIGNTFNGLLNDKGYFLRFVAVDNTNGYSITNTYDTEGFLLTSNSSYMSDAASNSNATYTYANGNLIQEKNAKPNNTVNYTVDYTYYEDKMNKIDLISNQNRPGMNGKFSKNLIKTIKYTYPDKTTEMYEYTYIQNTNGFVTSLTEKYTNKEAKTSTQTNKYEYVCL